MEAFDVNNWLINLSGGIITLLIEYIIFMPLKSKYEKAHPQPTRENKRIGELSIERLAISVVTGKSYREVNLLEVLGFVFSTIRWAFLGGIVSIIFLLAITLISLGLGVNVDGVKESIPQYFTLGVIIGVISRFIAPVIFMIVEFVQSKTSDTKEPNLTTIRRSINVYNIKNSEIEIFYDVVFVRPPNLTINIQEGSLDYVIIDQRSDGFKIQLKSRSSSGKGIVIEWIATGQLEK